MSFLDPNTAVLFSLQSKAVKSGSEGWDDWQGSGVTTKQVIRACFPIFLHMNVLTHDACEYIFHRWIAIEDPCGKLQGIFDRVEL